MKQAYMELGCGVRSGACYILQMKRNPDDFRVVALCDRNPKQLDKVHSLYGLEDTEDFTDVEVFLQKQRADVPVTARRKACQST